MLSIKEELIKAGYNPDVVLEVEYRKAIYYLEQIIFTTEKTLITLQEQDLPNQQRIESVEKTLNRLCLAWGNMNKLNSKVKELEEENRMLKAKFEHFKIKQ